VSRLRAIELELDRASLALEDLSQRRPGSRALGSETVDLAELAAYSVEAWRPLAIACGAGVRLDRPRGDWVVVGDRLRLAQALGNLIANGIEHGGGGVDVRLRAQPGRIRIEVVDRGAGLPAPLDELARRRRAGWTLRSPERGHGLAIASSIAADHGGRLAASPSQSGARLVLELPASADGSGRT
jgi:signal transduction histidine kinase